MRLVESDGHDLHGAVERHERVSPFVFGLTFVPAIGCYDGLFGPGTGSFFLILIVAVMGFDFLTSTALAKIANLTTNVAAIVVFGLSGNILWGLGAAMGVANLLGGFLGATMALKHGNGFVRKVFLVVIVALGLKLSWDMVAPLFA